MDLLGGGAGGGSILLTSTTGELPADGFAGAVGEGEPVAVTIQLSSAEV